MAGIQETRGQPLPQRLTTLVSRENKPNLRPNLRKRLPEGVYSSARGPKAGASGNTASRGGAKNSSGTKFTKLG
jgi:hypothetical protein